MAKAKPIPLSNTDDDPQALLASVLRIRFDEVLKHREAALDPISTDGVHDMRVANRRLRSVIRDFAEIATKFPLKYLRKTLERLGDRLGSVRDVDVLIEVLEELSQQTVDPDISKGLEAIIGDYRERRSSAFSDLERDLSEEYAADLEQRFDDALDTSLRQRELFQVSSVREAAERIISKCLDDVSDVSEGIYYPNSAKRLHRLRIAGKHLRYALELFQDVFGDELSTFVNETKNMQSFLGDIHDCDVWIAEVRSHLENGKRRDAAAGPKRAAAAWLIAQLARRRTKAYSYALDQWIVWEKSAFERRLKTLTLQ